MSDGLKEKIRGFSQQFENLTQSALGAVEQGLGGFSQFSKVVSEQIKSQLEGLEQRLMVYLDERLEQQQRKIAIKVRKLDGFVGELPSYQTEGASGFDLTAQISETLNLGPGERFAVPTGLIFEVPFGYELQIRPRSGRALKEGLGVPNSPGTIDSDYRGEVKVILINHSNEVITIKPQERMAQAVLCAVFLADLQVADQLSETQRDRGGFGHSGQ